MGKQMMTILDRLCAAAAVISLAILAPSTASANRIELTAGQATFISYKDEIALHANDGSMTIVGEFLSHQNATYRVKTALGEVWIDAATVQCEGVNCPSTADVLAGINAAENVLLSAD